MAERLIRHEIYLPAAFPPIPCSAACRYQKVQVQMLDPRSAPGVWRPHHARQRTQVLFMLQQTPQRGLRRLEHQVAETRPVVTPQRDQLVR